MVRTKLYCLLFITSLPMAGALAQGSKSKDTITAFNGAKIYVKQDLSADMRIIAQAQLLDLECSSGDAFRLRLGVDVQYFLPKLVSVNVKYAASYFSLQKMTAATNNLGQNDIKGFSMLELGGRLHILDRKGTARHKLTLSSSVQYTYGGNVTTTHYLKARMPCRRIFALRGGLYRTTIPVNTNMNNKEQMVGESGAVTATDGTVFSDVYFTNSYSTGFYAGLCDIINMSTYTTTNVSGYSGTRYFSSFFRELYADVLLTSTTIDPFIAAGTTYDIEPNTKGSFQTADIGWRVGKKMIFTRRTVNMGFSFEVGSRPGIAGRGAYFSTGMSIAFVK